MISATRTNLSEYYRNYPLLESEDIFKFLFQSVFGCEHMISDAQNVTDYIKSEWESLKISNNTIIEPLDGNFSRVYLDVINNGLDVNTLGKLFYLSSKANKGTINLLEEKLLVACEMVGKEILIDKEKFLCKLKKWKEEGYPAIHHSDKFRESYKPAYRVISNEYIPYLKLLSKIDSMAKNEVVNLAIEGGSASGKTTLGNLLGKIYDCNVFHIDDFFLQPEQRTKERFEEPGGNFDRERFVSQVLIPLSKNEPINYQRFSCSKQEIEEAVVIVPKKINIIEGAYSMHPELEKYYNLSVFLDIDSELQKKRILKRNTPEFAKRFFDEWIPLEHKYFESLNVKARCDIMISSEME